LFEIGRKSGARLRGFLLFWISLTGSESDSLQAEYRAGCDRARAFDRAARFDEDPRRLKLLAQITRRLTSRLSNKQRRWRVALIQADEFGARLAAAAGYDPRGAIRTFERMQHLEADTGLPLASYFASHPPFSERAAKLRGLIRVRNWRGPPNNVANKA
jgi:predicted Zn-dependent protease